MKSRVEMNKSDLFILLALSVNTMRPSAIPVKPESDCKTMQSFAKAIEKSW